MDFPRLTISSSPDYSLSLFQSLFQISNMRAAFVVAGLATLAAALPAVDNPEHALEPRGACKTKYTTGDYCGWFCSDCNSPRRPRLGGIDIGCVGALCISGCQTAIGYDGQCTSHWNDGSTWAFKCSHSSSGTYGMSRWKLKEMGFNCWGDNKGAGEEFWCSC